MLKKIDGASPTLSVDLLFSSEFSHHAGGLFAGLGIGGLAGLLTAYPDFKARLQEILTPEGTAAFAQGQAQCALADVLDFPLAVFESTK